MDLHSLTAAIPIGFGSDFDLQASPIPLSQDLFPTTILTSCFVPTCTTPLLVDTLNSPLRNTNKSRNFTHRMAMGMVKHDCPFLPLCHILTFTHLYEQFPLETKMSH
ncbi:hypothetical protein AVEN_248656-1 [Araneus ventricosus]|uniref:Uncharacterized protein n=1 Tax=Araneus ventricosus TaxID=182803 RepID=A0A4Y2C1R7_ARAVE|nr:hypothetical protein AVEN_248656-1 [Araneus ventricosus]